MRTLTDLDNYMDIQWFNDLRDYMDYFVNQSVFKKQEYWRIITDKEIGLPAKYKLIGWHNLLELSSERWNDHPRGGWGTKGPDKIIGDVEIWRLWKEFETLSFNEWIKLKK